MDTEAVCSVEMAFGIVLKRLREQKTLSQEELADLCGIHRTYVSQLERGLKSPTIRLIWQICEALAISPATVVAQITDTMKARQFP